MVTQVDAEAAALVRQAAELTVDLDEAQARALLEFRDLLLHWNRAFNLISRSDTGRIVPRHLLDSLTVAPWLIGDRVLDLGTGAGLPGVPLAIAREDVHFTLIDLSERRMRFVSRAARALKLANVSPQLGDVRSLPAGRGFDTIVCRAVADAGSMWSMASARLGARGRLVIMSRSQSRNGDQALPALPDDARLEARQRVFIPGLAQPHELVVLGHRKDPGEGTAADGRRD